MRLGELKKKTPARLKNKLTDKYKMSKKRVFNVYKKINLNFQKGFLFSDIDNKL